MKKVVKKVSAKPKPASVKKSAKKSSLASSPPKKKVAKKAPPKIVGKKKSPTTKVNEPIVRRPIRGNTTTGIGTQPAKSSREPVYYLERAGRVMTFSEGDKWLRENPAPLDSKPSFGSSVSISERATSTDNYDRRYGRDGK